MQHRRVAERVDDPGQPQPGHQPSHRGQPAQRGVAAGTAPLPALPVVGEEFGLVGCHVDVRRAVFLAALAGQAQVQRVAHRIGPPPVGDGRVGVPIQHLEQQPRPAAG